MAKIWQNKKKTQVQVALNLSKQLELCFSSYFAKVLPYLMIFQIRWNNNEKRCSSCLQPVASRTRKPEFRVPDPSLDAHTHDIILEDHAPPPAPGPTNTLCAKNEKLCQSGYTILHQRLKLNGVFIITFYLLRAGCFKAVSLEKE